MYWIFLVLIFLHFISYIFFFRALQLFKQEKMIFAFHLFLFLPSLLILSAALTHGLIESPTLLALLSLVLIYNMTFLDFWSLAQGSYSIQILLHVAASEGISEKDIISRTENIGSDKKKTRLDHLTTMKLARKTGVSKIELSNFGQLINYLFKAIKSLIHIKAAG